MLQFIKDLEPHVVGIHAIGEVTKEDMERVLLPRIDELVARQGEINYLLVLETDVSNWTAGAWWDDIKMGLKNFTKWNKIAVVSDQKGVQWFTNAFTYFVPGKSKGFALNQLDEAIAFVTAKEEESVEAK
ncbi:STAS/SEC14 domain-containing protein [Mucilaginibacter lutimaris]|uniref:STAS/SEC14 domain-containing protein n=1 Tax=Mucilaginibacter lutimaris TaxID=931629 RepID=A0ABW2ZGQ4_9SPHI